MYENNDFNTYFRNLKEYCEEFKKEEFVYSKRILDLNKKEFIILKGEVDSLNKKPIMHKKDLIIPFNKMMIEISSWSKESKLANGEIARAYNLGGILFFKELLGADEFITASSMWVIYDSLGRPLFRRPITISFKGCINLEKSKNFELLHIGSAFKSKNVRNYSELVSIIREEISEDMKNIVVECLKKIEKKEYTTYKKWTPSGYETKEIVYARDVCNHKRHFWSDTDFFNIPKMTREEWEKEGYGTDEVVFKDGELRRDVPFKIIEQYVQGKDKERKEDNRTIELFEKRHLRQEEKIYSILRELYPDKIIRRHDRKTLNGIELDFNIPELRLGIEYDGEQHFDKELYHKLYGEGFEEQLRRDREKDKLCRRKDIKLIRIKYDEPITLSHIRKRINA